MNALSRGEVESRTLQEALTVDFPTLLAHIAPAAKAPIWEKSIVRRMQQAAEAIGPKPAKALLRHPSDTVRGIAAYALMLNPNLTLARRLDALRRLADDAHFGVREWAWMAVRPHLVAQLPESIALLRPWVDSPSERIRRFAVEATRPRGVWCAHAGLLKAQPEMGLPLLEPLRADPAKYVQDSVANWLNDAAKSQPPFVLALCKRWRKESPLPATERICHRAQRSLRPTEPAVSGA
ncbi:MAG: DNA alkylation repair protein [Bryobacter sp.]|nr:DNA alkylation repair protein [Bryobacter sp.]